MGQEHQKEQREWIGYGTAERSAVIHGEKLSLLTRRERQVYQLLLRGQTNKEISNALGITERTARFHVSNILHKFGVANRIEILAKDWPESQ